MHSRIRVICIAAALATYFVLSFWGAVPARAEAPQEECASSPAEGAFLLAIANEFLTNGMDCTYSQGYMPEAEGDAVRIVLPLEPLPGISAPEEIRVSVDLGDTSAPFIFRNYDLTVPKEQAPSSDTPVYVVRLDLELRDERESGVFPVSFVCSPPSPEDGASEAFTVFVSVPEKSDGACAPDPLAPWEEGIPEEAQPQDPGDDFGTDDPADQTFSDDASSGGTAPDPGPAAASASPEPTPTPQPKLLLTALSVSPSPAEAGTPVTMQCTLRNTSASVPISNLLFEAQGNGTSIYAAGAGNCAFVPSVKPGETFTVSATLQTSPDAEPGPACVVLHTGYDGPLSVPFTQDETVALEVIQPVRFSVDEPDFPKTVAAGDLWSVPVNLMNMGRSKIYNAAASIQAPGIRERSTLYLGNLDAGTAREGTLYAFAGAKSEEAGEAKYGATSGTLTVSCEDEYGNVLTKEIPFEVKIEAPVIRSSAAPEMEEEDEKPALERTSALLIGAGAAGSAAAAWLYVKKREKKRREEF